MCEFCVRHGDGRKWYLKAEHYAGELLHDARRAQYVADFIPEMTAHAARWLQLLDRANRVSRRLTQRVTLAKSKKLQGVHFGQVIPIEDVAAILAIAGHVVRLPCVCRAVLEKREEAACYLVSASPDRLGLRELIGSREQAASFVAGMEQVSPGAALAQMESLEDQGAIHTVWTFITPFIGAICNCVPSGCLALSFTRQGLATYFPGEQRASVDATLCTGCGSCLEACQFAALALDGSQAAVNAGRCQGCGICRRRCPSDALSLVTA
jgi:ferredoxin